MTKCALGGSTWPLKQLILNMERLFKYKLDHLIFWIITIFFHIYTRTLLIIKADFAQFLLEIVVRNILLAFVIYVTLGILWPMFLPQKKYLAFVSWLFAIVLFYVLAKNAHDVYLYGFVMGDSSRLGFLSNTLYNFSIVLFYLAFSIALHLSKEWYFQKKLMQKIEIEKLSTELEYLKAQINPHFLFNSLNTVFFQIDKQNTKARDTLSKFSDMLRYQLYECNGKEVPIEKEIMYLNNYVDLQRTRSNENYVIEFISTNNLNGFLIAPLLLIPFVENAFKHVSHFAEGINEVKILINITESTFHFKTKNTIDKSEIKTDRAGIGLRNVQRRLELLYPNEHVLNIRKTEEFFEVDLELRMP